jgi:hypothetical protein
MLTSNDIRNLLLFYCSERDVLEFQLLAEPWLITERKRLRVVRGRIVELVGRLEACGE